MHYVKSTGGFYNTAIHGAAIPPDAIEISAQKYVELFDAQARGEVITADADGAPVAGIPTETPTKRAERAQTAVRAMRQGPLSVLDGLQASALVAGDTAGAKAIEEAKQSLRDAPALVGGPKAGKAGTYDERMTAARAEFARIAAMSPTIAKAFPP